MKQDIHILSSFSLNGRGGNPAGVVISDHEIPPHKRQAIANQVGLSETAFAQIESKQSISLRFHTPNREIANCGHATLAALRLMRDQDLIEDGEVQFATSEFVGIAKIKYKHIFMSQAAPAFEEIKDVDRVTDSIGIDNADLINTPEIVNTGNRFLVIPIKDNRTLRNLKPNHEKIKSLSNKFNLIGYYAFVASHRDPHRAYSRMFAPAYGIPEEAATGMAAGTLAGYLDRHDPTGNNKYEFYQGQFMSKPSPSRLLVTLDKEKGNITRIWVGGEARYVSMQNLEI